MGEVSDPDTENLEVELFLEAVYRKYGYDFRNYSRSHIKRRLLKTVSEEKTKSISELQHHILRDADIMERVLINLSINTTEMFRDPSFFIALRQIVIPLLATYPFIRIWNAGCASGEEAYSTAITVFEENLLDRIQIYATDFNEIVLRKAKEGIYPVTEMRAFTKNYHKAGGKNSFSDYYRSDGEAAIINGNIKDKITFANHNLVTDDVFGEMHMILCRNVFIYFNRLLQDNVLNLFHKSLCPGGFLCLGTKESLKYSAFQNVFQQISEEEKIYKKTLMADASNP